MAGIPEYRRQVFHSELPTMADNINRPNFVADAVKGVAEMGFQRQLQQEKIQNENYAVKASMELERRSNDIFNEWQKENELDPVGKEDQLNERLSKMHDEILNTAPSSEAQNEFKNVAAQYSHRMGMSASKWSDQQLITNTSLTAQQGLEAMQVKMLRNPAPQNFDLLIQEGDQMLSPLRQAAGHEVAEKTKLQYQSSLAGTMFEGLIEKNQLGTASALLNSKNYDTFLGADGISKVNHMIEVRRQQNEERAKKIEKFKTEDPWEYYKHMGGVPNTIAFAPEDDPTGKSLSDSILKREELIYSAKAQYGVELPLFTKAETGGLIKYLNAAPPSSVTGFFSFYDKNLTADQKIKLSKQVFEQEPSMGIALSMANSAPEDAQKIIVGQRLLRTDKSTKLTAVFTPKPGSKDLEAIFDTHIGNASEDPSFRQYVKAAARAHYAVSSLRGDKTLTSFDEQTFKDSIEAITGPVIRLNNRDAFSFRDKDNNYVDESGMEDFLENVTDEDIEAVHGDLPRTGDGKSINIQKASDRVSLISSGVGMYFVEFNGRVAVGKDGQPFEFNVAKTYERVPKGWLDRWNKKKPAKDAPKNMITDLKPGTPVGKL